MAKRYVQYGCGMSAPKEWINFDASPTLRIQKIPVVGNLLKFKLNTTFPSNVIYGDIIKGLPLEEEMCDGLYCSHVLEHLSLEDFRIALRNSFKILKKDGIYRCIVPDLEVMARTYVHSLDGTNNASASINFIRDTLLGVKVRKRGFRELLTSFYGNSHHLWMWDAYSLSNELKNAGFIKIRNCTFNDCEDEMFKQVEDASRFEHAVAIECRK